MRVAIPAGVFKDREPIMESRCFILMPFAPEFDAVYDVIRKTVRSAELECYRADDLKGPGDILEDVFQNIWTSDVIIADLTGRNANVFYELGLAHAINDHVILLTQDVADLPFDVAKFRVIVYENTMAGASQLESDLGSTLTAVISGTGMQAGPASATHGITPVLDLQRGSRRDDTPDLEIGPQTPVFSLAAMSQVAVRGGDTELADAVFNEISRRLSAGTSAGEDEVFFWVSIGVSAELAGEEELARKVFDDAMSVLPDDPVIRTTYASFLMDLQDVSDDDISEAGKLLDNLALDSTDRTLALRMQHATLIGTDTREIVDWALANFIPSDANSRVLMGAIQELGLEYEDQARRVVADWIAENPESRRSAQRALAEFLDESDDPALVDEAIDIYRSLLQDEPSDETNLDRAALLGLLALNLLQRAAPGDSEEAEALLLQAYEANPSDIRIRGIVGQYFTSIDRHDIANKVLRGEPLDE